MLHLYTFQKPHAHQFRVRRKTWHIGDIKSKAQVCKMFKTSKVCKPSNAIFRIRETSGEFLQDFIKILDFKDNFGPQDSMQPWTNH